MTCVGDWIKVDVYGTNGKRRSTVRCGDTVIEKGGRHMATVCAIWNGSKVRVRWEDTGWKTTFRLDEIEKVR